ncbi:MAG: DUF2304 domain-containing protein [Firmicutes bacterium]|nr:DUF2304 domain-containing protein [Bacillota bacterium]
MPLSQRIILFLGAGVTFLYFISGIRKNRLKINHSIFWIVFGLILLALACVPGALFWLSALLGFQSPSNLVYLIVIFLLVIKLFTTTVRLSRLSEQVTALAQSAAIDRLEREDEKKKARADTVDQKTGEEMR